jgi:uncharacterized protein DUF4838
LVIQESISTAAVAENITLASQGVSHYTIVSPSIQSLTEKFATLELKSFLDQLGGTKFPLSETLVENSILICLATAIRTDASGLNIPSLEGDEYGIFKRGQNIYLVGGNERSVLYAVYELLSVLGCRWVAPDYNFYEKKNQLIPNLKDIIFKYSHDLIRKPELRYRKLYIEEGLTHNPENLKKLIDWMPKARFNILVFPIDYEGKGRVRWDNWREQLTPELEKRGLIIEVGGHGYQNFLNAGMEEGKLYNNHSDWFGLDKNGKRSDDHHMVFCTSNREALNFFHLKLSEYLKDRPEIDIFDFWPPDSESWCECQNCQALGSIQKRHALLVNQTARFLKKENLSVQVECLAYSRYTSPPEHVIPDSTILIDFCPINQSFEYLIYCDSSEINKNYKENLLEWLSLFNGELSIYSYYRKYAWRSLPNIIPHYMQKELCFYHQQGIKGISVYSEPGDWFTYGLNHYIFSNLAWDPYTEVDSLIMLYCNMIYGSATEIVVSVYNELENIVRFACKIPHTQTKSIEQYNSYLARLEICRNRVKKACNENSMDEVTVHHLHRLGLMLDYAVLSVLEMRSTMYGNKNEVEKNYADIRKLMHENAELGIFIPR